MSDTDQLLRFGPPVVLAVTLAWLAFATRRTSASIGSRAYGLGTSFRHRLARGLLFTASIAAALPALVAYAAGASSALIVQMAGEASIVRLAGLVLAMGGQS